MPGTSIEPTSVSVLRSTIAMVLPSPTYRNCCSGSDESVRLRANGVPGLTSCSMNVSGVGIALALIALADLQHELAVLRKFQELIVGNRLEPGKIAGRAVVAANPDEALVVDMDAVLALDPLVARARSAPRSEIVAGSVEHHDGGRRHCGLIRLQRARPMQQKHLVLGIDRKARNIADPELRRHFQPSGLNLKARQRACL